MPEILIDVLQATAWPMTPPKPYSSFHLLLTAAGLSFAFLSARFLGRRGNGCQKKAIRILFVCGMLLALMEAYKQCFLYYLNGFRYNWWYFPFQLCSTPMYLCLLLPLAKKESTRTILASFLQDFGLLDADASRLLLAFSSLFYRPVLRILRTFRTGKPGLDGRNSALFSLLPHRSVHQYGHRPASKCRHVLHISLSSFRSAGVPPDLSGPWNLSGNPGLSSGNSSGKPDGS